MYEVHVNLALYHKNVRCSLQAYKSQIQLISVYKFQG
jgi:hypothetical protein